jgi:hypothetical protein
MSESHARSRRRALPLLLAALLAACAGEADAPAAADAADGGPAPLKPYLSGAPTDVVLRVNGEPILRADVEEVASQVAELFPSHVEDHWRREALVYLVLTRATLAARFPEERATALADARAALDALNAGEAPAGEAPKQVEGGWPALSLQLWSAARQLEPGAWSAPIEQIGQISLVRLVERGGLARRPQDEEIVVEVLTFPYLDRATTADELQAFVDAATLVVEDPLYERIVPETWKYRMRGASS